MNKKLCNKCLERPVEAKGRKKFRAVCWKCHLKFHTNGKKAKYKKHKTNSCSLCGFVAIHECQLDVDHIDGNHQNNDIKNLQTLCANCHRIKTLKDIFIKFNLPSPL